MQSVASGQGCWGPGIFPGCFEFGPCLLSVENIRKIEPKGIPRCLIPHLIVVFTWQLEILAITLPQVLCFPQLGGK